MFNQFCHLAGLMKYCTCELLACCTQNFMVGQMWNDIFFGSLSWQSLRSPQKLKIFMTKEVTAGSASFIDINPEVGSHRNVLTYMI